jgi:hypothetical protein
MGWTDMFDGFRGIDEGDNHVWTDSAAISAQIIYRIS